jgi:hypothetical protein
MKSSQLKATAYHEAGHAVAAWRLGIALGRKGVTIVPDEAAGTGGSSAHRGIIDPSIEYDTSDRNRIRAEKTVQSFLAGEVAQRRYNPRSVRNHHGYFDRHEAINTLSYFTNEEEELRAWLKLLRIRAECMFRNPDVWRAVERLGAALMERRTIGGKEATEIIHDGFKEALYKQHPEMRSQDLAMRAQFKASAQALARLTPDQRRAHKLALAARLRSRKVGLKRSAQ